MTDFPTGQNIAPPRGLIHVAGLGQPCGMLTRAMFGSPAAAAWPAANRALYIPFLVGDFPVLATQGWFYMGAQAGNYDIGIYDANRTRLVSMGSTAVPANTNSLVLANFADTTLSVGQYWLGIVMSTVTTLTVFRYTANLLALQTSGVQQEALGSTVLPATATFANPANSFLPICGLLTDLAA